MTEERNKVKMPPSDWLTVFGHTFAETHRDVVCLRLLTKALEHLKVHVEKEGWENPRAELQYDVKEVFGGATPPKEWSQDKELTEDEFACLLEKDLDRSLTFCELSFMREATRGVTLYLKSGVEDGRPFNSRILLPPDLWKEHEALPEDKREGWLHELSTGFDLRGWQALTVSGTADTPDGPKPFNVVPVCIIRPLTVDPKAKRAYHPVFIGLDFMEGGPPPVSAQGVSPAASWSEKDRADLWNYINAGIHRIALDATKRARVAPPAADDGPEAAELDARLKELEAALRAEQIAMGLLEPDRVVSVPPEVFAVAAGFGPMHHLAKRNRGGLPLFPEERRRFHELRTPLNWAVGLALFSRTSETTPEGWQEVTVADLVDRAYCLAQRDARRRGDHRSDILAEVVKLHSEKNAYVRYDWEKRGRSWRRNVTLGSDYAIPNLELVFVDSKTGRRALPNDPALRRLVIPLEVEGRRAYTPDGTDIKALPKGRYRLDRIRWRWNPSFADDLKAEPARDDRNRIKRDAKGQVLRGGFNIRVAVCIFEALFRLRREKAFVAHDLLVILALDIYKPPPQCKTDAGRYTIEREAERLFDLLGLEADPKHPKRREEMVAAAVARLMGKDIGALRPMSDTTPRSPSEAELASGRRKAPYYRLVRSPRYTPAARLVTKEDAEILEAETVEVPAPSVSKKLQPVQTALPGMEHPPAPAIPAGADIRAARKAAALNLRRFAELMGGPNFSTWSRYESGKSIRVEDIKPEVRQRVRDFVAEHRPKADPAAGQEGA